MPEIKKKILDQIFKVKYKSEFREGYPSPYKISMVL